MQKNNLISIVLPVYNGERYLEQQIRSIMAQHYRNIEIIIIDDTSKDKSLDIANRLAVIDDRIKVYKNSRNLGVVPNFLKAASLASGEFVCSCDQDDYWRKDKIEILKKLLEESDENMLAYSDLEICDEDLKCIHSSFLEFTNTRPKKGYLRELSFLRNIVPGVAVMFRKKVRDMLAVVSADAPFMHDHLVLILSSGLGRIVYSKEKLVKYRQHPGNVIGAFYDSVIDKDRIIRELTQKINYFKKVSFKGLNLDLDRMWQFCECLRNGGIFKRLSFLDCYLFLRNDTLLDKSLALLECLSPGFYSLLRKVKRTPGALAWVKGLIFAIWCVVVLLFFTKEFVVYKLIKFLGYR